MTLIVPRNMKKPFKEMVFEGCWNGAALNAGMPETAVGGVSSRKVSRIGDALSEGIFQICVFLSEWGTGQLPGRLRMSSSYRQALVSNSKAAYVSVRQGTRSVKKGIDDSLWAQWEVLPGVFFGLQFFLLMKFNIL